MNIYKTTNKITGLIYVGKESRPSKKYYGSGNLIIIAIKEFGIENFEKEILEECYSKEELNEREKYWIKFHGCLFPYGYNIVPGGQCGDVFTYNPNAQKIRDNLSRVCKEKMQDVANNPFYGKHHTDENKQLISEINKKFWEEVGHDESICNCSSCKSKRGWGKGEENGMYGKNHTEESKEKISKTRKERYSGVKSPNYIFIGDDTRQKIFEMYNSGININRIRKFFGLSFKKVKNIITGKDV